MNFLILAAALLPGYTLGGAAGLAAPVESFHAAGVPVAAAFLSVSRAYGITFVLDPAVKGEVALEVRGGTVGDLVEALARVFRQESQDKVSVLLEKSVLPTVAPVGFSIRKMLRAIQLNNQTGFGA